MSQTQTREPYITAREVAERLGLSPDTILRYYREGRIPAGACPARSGRCGFRWSEVEAAWDCRNQLTLEEPAAA